MLIAVEGSHILFQFMVLPPSIESWWHSARVSEWKKTCFSSLPKCSGFLWIKKRAGDSCFTASSPKSPSENTTGQRLENQEHVSVSSLFRICIICLLTKWPHACWCGIRGPQSNGRTAAKQLCPIQQQETAVGALALGFTKIWSGLGYSFLSDRCFYAMGKWVRALWIRHGPKPQESTQSLWGTCHGFCSPVLCQSV